MLTLIRTATGTIYSAAGYTRANGDKICAACGATGAGIVVDEWVRPTFVDFDKLRPGSIICDACEFCFTDRNEDLRRITQKDKPQRMRNYSHFVVAGRWEPVSKGDKAKMIGLLEQSPTLAVVADSGQKHIIFRARVGWWQFEETAIRPDIGGLMALIRPMRRLLSVFSKAEIASGSYSAGRIRDYGLDAWRAVESIIKPERGSALFSLALFLAQKEN